MHKDHSGHKLPKFKGNTEEGMLVEPKQEPPETPRFPDEPVQIRREQRYEHRGRDDYESRRHQDRGERNHSRDDQKRKSHAENRYDRGKKMQVSSHKYTLYLNENLAKPRRRFL